MTVRVISGNFVSFETINTNRVNNRLVSVKVLISLIVEFNDFVINFLDVKVSHNSSLLNVVMDLEFVSVNIVVGVPHFTALRDFVVGFSRFEIVSIFNNSIIFVTDSPLGVEGILLGGDGHDQVVGGVILGCERHVVSSHGGCEVIDGVAVVTDVSSCGPVEVSSRGLTIEVLGPLSVGTGGVVVGGGELWGLVVGEGGSLWLSEGVNRVGGTIQSSMDVLSVVGFLAWQGVDLPIVNIALIVVDSTCIIVVIILIYASYFCLIITPFMVVGISIFQVV